MEAVRIGETTEILTDLDKHNSISAEVKHASRQLDAVASEQDFRLLWYRADRGPFVSNTKEQIGSTLYGMRMVLAERPSISGKGDRFIILLRFKTKVSKCTLCHDQLE
jgi:hypothetical protein